MLLFIFLSCYYTCKSQYHKTHHTQWYALITRCCIIICLLAIITGFLLDTISYDNLLSTVIYDYLSGIICRYCNFYRQTCFMICISCISEEVYTCYKLKRLGSLLTLNDLDIMDNKLIVYRDPELPSVQLLL